MAPSTPRSRRLRVRAVAIVAMLAAPLACNVFVSIAKCESDGDCGPNATCDPQGKFCIKNPPIDSGPDVRPDVDGGVDAPADAPPDSGCATQPFETAVLVKGFENLDISSARFFPKDENKILVSLSVDGGLPDIYAGARPSLDGAFAMPLEPLTEINLPNTAEYWASMSADENLIIFESDRDLADGGTLDQARIWQAERTAAGLPFSKIQSQSVFQTPPGGGAEGSPYLSPTYSAIYFLSLARPGAGDIDLFFAPFGIAKTAGTPENLGFDDAGPDAAGSQKYVNTAHAEFAPFVTSDDLTLLFAREDDQTLPSIWMATRSSTTVQFGNATELGGIVKKAGKRTFPAYMSDDACRLYFISNRDPAPTGQFRLWVAKRSPK